MRTTPFVVGLLALVPALGCSTAPPLETASGVTIESLAGTYHEIAKLPRPTQASCTATTITYAPRGDRELDVTTRCRLVTTDGPERVQAMHASADDPSDAAKLTLTVLGFSGAHWVIDRDPAYGWIVVGHPSREALWILSRTPSLDAATLEGILARANAKSFDTSALEWTTQSASAPAAGEGAASDAPVPPEPRTGCALAAAHAPTTPSAWPLAIALAGLAWGARRRRAPRFASARAEE